MSEARNQLEEFALPAIRSGVFISDLHLFSRRCDPAKLPIKALQQKEVHDGVVLGGDIFDFKWSDRGGLLSTIHAALDWLERLLDQTGQSPVFFLLGNHDCHPEFVDHLNRLALEESRFNVLPHHLQLGDCLFLHGDILDAGYGQGSLEFYRQKFHHVDSKHSLLHHCYDLAVLGRMHKLIPSLLHAPEKTCARLLSSVDSLALPDRDRVRQVFFGHTHVPIQRLAIDGIVFSNPGAALKHMEFQACEFVVKE